jgi:hypothetical protein
MRTERTSVTALVSNCIRSAIAEEMFAEERSLKISKEINNKNFVFVFQFKLRGYVSS